MLAVLAFALALALPAGSEAHGGVDADLVIDFGDGRGSIHHLDAISGTTGLELLRSTDLEVVTRDSDFGTTVCAVGGVGCPADDCFCACPGEDCRFWAYHHGTEEGGWASAQEGPGDYVLPEGGAIEGWVWGKPAPMAYSPSRLSAHVAWDWLRDEIQPDGSLFSAGVTVDGVLAAQAVHADVASWRWGPGTSGNDPIEALRSRADEYSATNAATAGKLLAGVSALDQATDPRGFGGVNLVERVTEALGPNGRYGASTWEQGWAILGLTAAGEPVPDGALDALEDGAAPGGGWGDLLGAEDASVDATGLALSALALAGRDDSQAVDAGLGWLDSVQSDTGGWGTGPGKAANVNSTALAVQSLRGLALDPRADDWRTTTDPLAWLRSQQLAEGPYLHDPRANELLATVQAIPAMAGRPLVVPGTGPAVRRLSEDLLVELSEFDGPVGYLPSTLFSTIALTEIGVEVGDDVRDRLISDAEIVVELNAHQIGLYMQAVSAIGLDVTNIGGIDVVSRLMEHYDLASGAFQRGTVLEQAWAIEGLAAAGRPIPDLAVDHLIELAEEDGTWPVDDANLEGKAIGTGIALRALDAAGRSPEDLVVRTAVAALRDLQATDGRFATDQGAPDVPVTAFAVSGLAVVGQHVDGPGWARSPDDGLTWYTPREHLADPTWSPDAPSSTSDDVHLLHRAVVLRGLVARAPYEAPKRGGRVHLPMLVKGR